MSPPFHPLFLLRQVQQACSSTTTTTSRRGHHPRQHVSLLRSSSRLPLQRPVPRLQTLTRQCGETLPLFARVCCAPASASASRHASRRQTRSHCPRPSKSLNGVRCATWPDREASGARRRRRRRRGRHRHRHFCCWLCGAQRVKLHARPRPTPP